jgi:hypothetical protein
MEVFSLFDLCPEREIRQLGCPRALSNPKVRGNQCQPLFQFVVCLGYILLPPTCTKTHLMPYALQNEFLPRAPSRQTLAWDLMPAVFHLPALGFHTLQHLRKLTLVYLKILARSA